MNYEIKGAPMPVVEVKLEAGEALQCEGGAMSWMTDNLKMETQGGGIGKMFSRALSGESLFLNKYTAEGKEGMIAFASSFPGDIIAIELQAGESIVCQKSAYLASSEGVELSIFFQKKLGAGFFGGEGFIMQKLTGPGIVFLEIDGSTVTKELAAGEKIILDTGHLAMMDETCSVNIVTVKGIKNKMLGGEGFFNTEVTGPGKVTLQTLPAPQLAGVIGKYIPTSSN